MVDNVFNFQIRIRRHRIGETSSRITAVYGALRYVIIVLYSRSNKPVCKVIDYCLALAHYLTRT